MEQRRRTVAIVGLGDLGKRIAWALSAQSNVDELILIGRNESEGTSFTALLSASTDCRISFACLDALRTEELAGLFHRTAPAVIVQSASLLSPWATFEQTEPAMHFLKTVGFVVQLPAQLPILISTMKALKLSGCPSLVVNCSYPDVTHPILDKMGLCPTIGVGNAGILLGIAKSVLKSRDNVDRLRLIAHHSHVAPIIQKSAVEIAEGGPRLFVGEGELPNSQWMPKIRSMRYNREINALAAIHATSLSLALLPNGSLLMTSAPGPFGLPGGWPIQVANESIELDLPTSVTQTEIIRTNEKAARLDGLESVGRDGTAYMTDEVRSQVASHCSGLAEPLHPDECLGRFALLNRYLT